MYLLTGYFVKLKSVIFAIWRLFCRILFPSNFPAIQYLQQGYIHTYIHTYIRGHAVGAGAPNQSLIALLISPYAEIHHIEARYHSKLIH